MSRFARFLQRYRLALCTAVMGLAGAASAAIPEAFDTNLTALQTDVESLIGKFAPFVVAIITAMLVLVGLDYAWRVIRSKL